METWTLIRLASDYSVWRNQLDKLFSAVEKHLLVLGPLGPSFLLPCLRIGNIFIYEDLRTRVYDDNTESLQDDHCHG